MSTKNSNVPSAVGTNRTYVQTITENLQNGWEKIKTNPYVNMFFPISDVADGNTLAAATAIIPGKQLIVQTAKTLSAPMTAEKIAEELNGLGPAIGGNAFYKDLAKRISKAFPSKARKQLGNLYKRLQVGDIIPTPDGKYLQYSRVQIGPDSDGWRFVVKDKPPVEVQPRPAYTPKYDTNGIEILPFKHGGSLNYLDHFK